MDNNKPFSTYLHVSVTVWLAIQQRQPSVLIRHSRFQLISSVYPFIGVIIVISKRMRMRYFFCYWKNVLKQNGQFDGWNSIKVASCQLVQRNAQGQLIAIDNSTIMGLGAMNSAEFLYRSISLSKSTVTNRVIIKFSVAIDDASIEAYFSTNGTSSPSSTTSNTSDVQKDVTTETRT